MARERRLFAGQVMPPGQILRGSQSCRGQSVATLRGVYRIKGDRLEVCCRPNSRKEEERPKEFTTDDNDADRLVIYKRVKGTAK